jgi:nicotinamide-nucleotide amidase
MAAGMQLRSGAAVAIGVTGIAGRAAGPSEKPVGTVRLPLSSLRWCASHVHFVGGREQVKFQAAQAALNMLRLMLAETG